jgi:TetR/AcrR family transcriptional repressor of nem operon
VATHTKQQLLEQGMAMLLKHGYHDLGITAVLATNIPKGSFYLTSRRRKTSDGRSSTCT